MRPFTAFIGCRRRCSRAALTIAIASSAAAATGCATLRATVHGYEHGPGGIAKNQQRLRDALVRGDFPTALAWSEDDELLRALTRATSAYYASQLQRAGVLLDSAALLADDRITASLSRDALALLTSDNARPYRPRPTERLFIAYYGMLSYVRLESWEDAAVEARRMVALIAQRDGDRDDDERPLHAALEHLAGAVFERSGRSGEAQVAYRAAHAILDASPEAMPRPRGGEGEVLVVLERGFVTYRVTEQVNVFFRDDEADSADTAKRDDPRWDRRWDHRRREDDEDGYWLAVGFPALRHGTRPMRDAIRLSGQDPSSQILRIASVLDDAAAVDERRDRVATMARAVARAGAKYAIAKAVKDKKGESAGKLANIAASMLERADVRSWHLLPQEVQVFRLAVPAGRRTLRLELAEGGDPSSVIELPPVVVRPGEVTIVPYRLWRDAPAAPLVAAR
jgi:hypothetical protein